MKSRPVNIYSYVKIVIKSDKMPFFQGLVESHAEILHEVHHRRDPCIYQEEQDHELNHLMPFFLVKKIFLFQKYK